MIEFIVLLDSVLKVKCRDALYHGNRSTYYI